MKNLNNYSKGIAKFLSVMMIFMVSAGNANARILFSDESYPLEAETLILDSNNNSTGATLQFGNEGSTDGTISYDTVGGMTTTTPTGLGWNVNVGGVGFNANATVNASTIFLNGSTGLNFSANGSGGITLSSTVGSSPVNIFAGDSSTVGMFANSADNEILSITGSNSGAGEGNVQITADDKLSLTSSSWSIADTGAATGLSFDSISTSAYGNVFGYPEYTNSTMPVTCTQGEKAFNTEVGSIFLCNPSDSWTELNPVGNLYADGFTSQDDVTIKASGNIVGPVSTNIIAENLGTGPGNVNIVAEDSLGVSASEFAITALTDGEIQSAGFLGLVVDADVDAEAAIEIGAFNANAGASAEANVYVNPEDNIFLDASTIQIDRAYQDFWGITQDTEANILANTTCTTSPGIGSKAFATDTQKLYVCSAGDVWTDTTPTATLGTDGYRTTNDSFFGSSGNSEGEVITRIMATNAGTGTANIQIDADDETSVSGTIVNIDSTTNTALTSNSYNIFTISDASTYLGGSPGDFATGVQLNSYVNLLGYPEGTSLPPTCTVGDFFLLDDGVGTQELYECTTTDSWTLRPSDLYMWSNFIFGDRELSFGAEEDVSIISRQKTSFSAKNFNVAQMDDFSVALGEAEGTLATGMALTSFNNGLDSYPQGGTLPSPCTDGDRFLLEVSDNLGNLTLELNECDAFGAWNDIDTNTYNWSNLSYNKNDFTQFVLNDLNLWGDNSLNLVNQGVTAVRIGDASVALGETEGTHPTATSLQVFNNNFANNGAGYPAGGTLPSTCTVGDRFALDETSPFDGNQDNLYECTATDTWTQVDTDTHLWSNALTTQDQFHIDTGVWDISGTGEATGIDLKPNFQNFAAYPEAPAETDIFAITDCTTNVFTSPGLGFKAFALDTEKLYVCASGDVWEDITPSATLGSDGYLSSNDSFFGSNGSSSQDISASLNSSNTGSGAGNTYVTADNLVELLGNDINLSAQNGLTLDVEGDADQATDLFIGAENANAGASAEANVFVTADDKISFQSGGYNVVSLQDSSSIFGELPDTYPRNLVNQSYINVLGYAQGATLPVTCAPVDHFVLNDGLGTNELYECVSIDNWVLQDTNFLMWSNYMVAQTDYHLGSFESMNLLSTTGLNFYNDNSKVITLSDASSAFGEIPGTVDNATTFTYFNNFEAGYPSSVTLPGTCTTGERFLLEGTGSLNDNTFDVYECTATDTWTIVDDDLYLWSNTLISNDNFSIQTANWTISEAGTGSFSDVQIGGTSLSSSSVGDDGASLIGVDSTGLVNIVSTDLAGALDDIDDAITAIGGAATNYEVLTFNSEYPNTSFANGGRGILEAGLYDAAEGGYYQWEVSNTTTQYIDVITEVPVPTDASSVDSISLRAYLDDASSVLSNVQLIIENASGSCASENDDDTTADAWQTMTESNLTSCAFGPGDNIIIRTTLGASTGNQTRIGELSISYSN